MLIAFEGLSRPVALVDSEALLQPLAAVLRGWRFGPVAADAGAPPLLTISGGGGRYRLESPWLASPVAYVDPVDAVCALIVDLVRAYVADDPSLLCLHCGAAEFAGRLVIFPSRYRAGKSTLMARLAAAGSRVFADDVLPIAAPDNAGRALGIAPRLRLPLPAGASQAFRDFVAARRGPGNRRYLYLDLPPETLVRYGATAPIGGFVLLDRRTAGPAVLTAAPRGQGLQRAILQNFARGAALETVDRLAALVAGGHCFTLRYSDLDAAAELLRATFGSWPPRPPAARGDAAAAEPPAAAPRPRAAAPVAAGQRFVRRPDIAVRELDHELFLVGADDRSIYHLNPIAAALWRLLDEPMPVGEAVGVLCEAFPEIDAARIEGDVNVLFADLVERGLLVAAPA
ncbi:MAG TPA: PqqD family protein [Dongiaceae bacterium]|nr:PqqD family protein [Dongiaceae bacterium]